MSRNSLLTISTLASRGRALGMCFLVGLAVAAPTATAEDLFETQVRGIFERRCLHCHNDEDREGELSLQSAEGLRAGGAGGAAIDVAAPDASLLLEYISGDAPEMPKDGEPLAVEEVAAIRAWITDGAAWPADVRLEDKSLADHDWWSLQPITQVELPRVNPELIQRAHTPLDLFILARLEQHGLQLSPEADRRTLLRRLYFDLIGLPPTPEEVQAFLTDPSPRAYEGLVERLLASPHYGERWARHWLDVVKYADTCGYDKDKLRPQAWPYRDYVIRSLNEDKPYARFAQEQIAGDVLFPGEPDGILGLGFLAAGPWDFIGHVEVPESKLDGQVARNIDRDDMVSNTLNTFNSVTIQCARCHNHKFDPFTQRHYYSLQAVFAAVDRAERPYDLDPSVEQQRRELKERIEQSKQELAQHAAAIQAAGGEELATVEARMKELQSQAQLRDKQPAFGYHSHIEPEPNREKWVQVDLGREMEIQQVVLRPCHDDYAGIGAGFGFPVRFRLDASLHDATFQSRSDRVTVSDQTAHDLPNPGLAPWTVNASGVRARYLRVTATKLAKRSNDFIFALAELQVLDPDGNNVAAATSVTALDSIEAPIRWARSNLTDGIWARAANDDAVRKLAEVQQQRQQIMARINTPERIAAREKLQQQVDADSKQLAALPQGRMVHAAATDFAVQGNFKPTRGQPRTIRLLHRGNVDAPRDEMRPGTLPILDGFGEEFDLPEEHSEGDRRAALSRWITDEAHPLTWRSIVNRVWLYHFGNGIVESPNDFGRMGQLPTHPELLDWLAVEFRDRGQSLKDLHRLIVTSAVYRQRSTDISRWPTTNSSDDQVISSALAIDASNRLLWRMNRRRLEAEEIRDSILSVSGSLNPRMGGPGYYLFVLEKPEHSPHFEYHKFDPADPTSHRRAVYRFVARSQPNPYMTTLDCADSSQSTPQRNETLTSLQALSLLNNNFNLVMSQYFAGRLAAERNELDEQVARAMWLATGRAPTELEQTQLSAFAQEHGLANLCRVLFNLSEFIYLD